MAAHGAEDRLQDILDAVRNTLAFVDGITQADFEDPPRYRAPPAACSSASAAKSSSTTANALVSSSTDASVL